MKIKCNYCGNFFNDTKEQCPNCGAPNPGVVRTVSKQPLTIEQLQDWYQSKGLPPYETTRFFIGENHTGPRAFGIYKDNDTGNYVVYKNKDNGQRVIRYEGSDEAYAVNELYQRLKEEIIQQKSKNVKKGQTTKSQPSVKHPVLKGCLIALLVAIGLPIGLFVVIFITVIIQDYPDRGYYSYGNSTYYNFINDETTADTDWFIYSDSSSDWSDPLVYGLLPKELKKNATAKEYFLCEEWNASLPVSDFRNSNSFSERMIDYYDRNSGYKVDTGYYQHSGNTYYHLKPSSTVGWYVFDTISSDWEPITPAEVPYDLQHTATASDFYYTPEWDSTTQLTDFKDSDAYATHYASSSSGSSGSSSSSHSSSSYSWDDDDDTSWDSSSYSWDSSSTDWDSDW